MLVFATFLPHPPISVPEIGKENIKRCRGTINGYKKIASAIEDVDIDTLLIISPHTSIHPYAMTISLGLRAEGDFSQFDAPQISISKEIDIHLAQMIYQITDKHKIPVRLHNQGEVYPLDHGVMVPLYHLQNHLPSSLKIVVIGYSMLSRSMHIRFGECIGNLINRSDTNVALVSSGDLSHRIFENGAEFVGKLFDKQISDTISSNQLEKLLTINEDLQEEAGECGYRSLLISLGIFKEFGFNKIKPKVISYQAPFGVGYLVANFVLK